MRLAGCVVACALSVAACGADPVSAPTDAAAESGVGHASHYVYGTVATRFGEPLPGAVVTLGDRSTRTDGHGDFALTRDVSDPPVVRISRRGMQAVSVELAARGDQALVVSLRSNEDTGDANWIQLVTGCDRAIPDAAVRLSALDGDELLWEGRTGASGRLWPPGKMLRREVRIELMDGAEAQTVISERRVWPGAVILFEPANQNDNAHSVDPPLAASSDSDGWSGWVLGATGRAVASFAAAAGAPASVRASASDHIVTFSAGDVVCRHPTVAGADAETESSQIVRVDGPASESLTFAVHSCDAWIAVASRLTALELGRDRIGVLLPQQPRQWRQFSNCILSVRPAAATEDRWVSSEDERASGRGRRIAGTSQLSLTAAPGLPDIELDVHLVRLGVSRAAPRRVQAWTGCAEYDELSVGVHVVWFAARGSDPAANSTRTVGTSYVLVGPGRNEHHIRW